MNCLICARTVLSDGVGAAGRLIDMGTDRDETVVLCVECCAMAVEEPERFRKFLDLLYGTTEGEA